MKLFFTGLIAILLMSATAFAADFDGYDSSDIAMANQIINSGSCSNEQKAAFDDLFDAADLSAYFSGNSKPSNAAEATLVKAASICH
jgi:hypothetical protein